MLWSFFNFKILNNNDNINKKILNNNNNKYVYLLLYGTNLIFECTSIYVCVNFAVIKMWYFSNDKKMQKNHISCRHFKTYLLFAV